MAQCHFIQRPTIGSQIEGFQVGQTLARVWPIPPLVRPRWATGQMTLGQPQNPKVALQHFTSGHTIGE